MKKMNKLACIFKPSNMKRKIYFELIAMNKCNSLNFKETLDSIIRKMKYGQF